MVDALEMLRASYCPTCKTAEACSEETPCAKWAALAELRRLRAIEAAALAYRDTVAEYGTYSSRATQAQCGLLDDAEIALGKALETSS